MSDAFQDTRKTGQLLLDSINPEHYLAGGSGNYVYRFDSVDPVLSRFLIRVEQGAVVRKDTEGGLTPRTNLRNKLLKSTSLSASQRIYTRRNIAQPALSLTEKKDAFSRPEPVLEIVPLQTGESLIDWRNALANASRAATEDERLAEAKNEITQTLLDGGADAIAPLFKDWLAIAERGYTVDKNIGNVFYDAKDGLKMIDPMDAQINKQLVTRTGEEAQAYVRGLASEFAQNVSRPIERLQTGNVGATHEPHRQFAQNIPLFEHSQQLETSFKSLCDQAFDQAVQEHAADGKDAFVKVKTKGMKANMPAADLRNLLSQFESHYQGNER